MSFVTWPTVIRRLSQIGAELMIFISLRHTQSKRDILLLFKSICLIILFLVNPPIYVSVHLYVSVFVCSKFYLIHLSTNVSIFFISYIFLWISILSIIQSTTYLFIGQIVVPTYLSKSYDLKANIDPYIKQIICIFMYHTWN